MAELIIEVPENWKAFLQDVAEHMKKDSSEYWGEYLVDHLSIAMHDDDGWIFGNLQGELVQTHGLSLGDRND